MNQITLTPQIFEDKKNDAEFIRAIAYTHPCADAQGNFIHFKGLQYPLEWIVTPEHKKEAETLREAQKQAFKSSIGNKLVFVSMGCIYEARFDDDVCNHRIRTEIINPQGRNFFIEVGTGRPSTDLMHITHVTDRDQEKHYNAEAARLWPIAKDLSHDHPRYLEYKKYSSQPYYWFKREQWEGLRKQYSLKNVLELVNNLFECNFTEIEIDNTYLSQDDYKSISPAL